VLGRSEGAWIVDRHHRHHPAARRWHAENTLSFGFTSHYELMSNLFRPTPLGHAGENVIVAADSVLTIEDMSGGMRIETGDGHADLTTPAVMEPCVEFTRFMTSRPDANAHGINPDRQKLRNGVRGYALGYLGSDPLEVRPGDTVSIRSG
jgi:hypothetical protein